MGKVKDEYDDGRGIEVPSQHEQIEDDGWEIDVPLTEEVAANSKKFDECWGPCIDFDADRFDAGKEDPFEFFDKHDTNRVDPQDLEEKRMEQEGWIIIEDNWTCLVLDDIVRFTELVWGDDYFDKEVKGTRTNTVYITRRSYSRQGKIRIYFKVIESFGTFPLDKDKQVWRASETILSHKEYGQKCYRKRWADESQREEAISECKQHHSELLNKLDEERQRELQEIAKEFAVGYASESVSDDNDCNDESAEDDEVEQVEQLSEEEHQWVDSEWHKDVLGRTVLGHRRLKWVLDKGWTPLFNTYDEAIVGDIIRFSNPNYTYRYPKGKYCGSSIVVAEVVKIGREYLHLKLLACRGEEPHCKSGGFFKKRFRTVYCRGAYRLKWQEERLRMGRYCDHTRSKFDFLEDYLDFIKPEATEYDD